MNRTLRAAAVLGLLAAVASCAPTIEVRDPPIVIGVLAPTTGSLQQTGDMMATIAQLAADQINAAGGVDGRRLEIRISDIGNATDVDAAFRALVGDGALAVIGPATQEQVVSAVPAAVATKTVFISPVSTTPWRVGGRPADDGYLLRDVASDELQTLALAYFLRTLDGGAPTTAAVLTESFCDCGQPTTCSLVDRDFATELARGVANYFECFFENPAGGRNRVVASELLYRRGLSDTEVITTVNQINSLDPIPQVVVLAGIEPDALRIIGRYIMDHPNASTIPQIRWITTATTKTPGFIANLDARVFADLPATANPIAGSAPTSPVVGHAYRTLDRAYRKAFNDEDVSLRAFAPNVWDAVYLAAAGLTKQSIAGEALGGPGLRAAVRAVSAGGPILHAGQWLDLTTILQSGGDVDYDGASGPVDLDDSGEVVGPYEIWQVHPAGTAFVFERAFYIDARTIPDVLETFGVAAGGTIGDLVGTCSIPPAESCQ